MNGNIATIKGPHGRSARRTMLRMEGIIEAHSNCTHKRTKTIIEPDTIEVDGRTVEGSNRTVCLNPTCGVTVDWTHD